MYDTPFRLLSLLLLFATAGQPLRSSAFDAVPIEPVDDWQAEWIGVIGGSKFNSWICYRKQVEINGKPEQAVARIACDSKYWLWINGRLAVFEGQLKRGPTPHDTYFDRVDLTEFFDEGTNTIAVLVWHFGQHGFSHNSSGKAALLFDAEIDGRRLSSDASWKVRIHPAYGTTDPPKDNVRQPEPNIRFDARHDIGAWHLPDYDDSSWGPPTVIGEPPAAPWNRLYERPIPQWKNSGRVLYASQEVLETDAGKKHVCRLPYNAHVSPYLKVRATAGKVIGIHSDIHDLYGRFKLIEVHRHEYVTREGVQEFELLPWISGHEVHYVVPNGVEVLELAYRETGYDTEFAGSFECEDPGLNQLWEESLRTLYVTMRDTYMDCPDRERAQWWGDAVNELGEAFYALDPVRSPLLARKGIYELTRWQRDDQTLYSPVPSGIRRPGIEFPLDGSWEQELPQQMLASIGWYGFWTYYWYSGDEQTIRDAYPAVKRYLSLWKLGEDGLVVHRPGGWDWTDWGSNIDVPVVENAWLYLALKGAVAMAKLTGHSEDVADYRTTMQTIEANYRRAFWRGDEYRSAGYTGETDDRANAMAVVSGLARAGDYPAVVEVLKRERHASPYMEKYVLEALLLMDQPDAAFARMLTRYDRMLNDEQTTLWETFEELKLDGFGSLGYGTYNHAWSGGPLTILSQYVAGVAPTKPAFDSYEILPQTGRLRHLRAVVPTRHGPIELELDRRNAPLEARVVSPDGAEGVFGIASDWVSSTAMVSVNEQPLWTAGEATAATNPVRFLGAVDGHLRFSLPPGTWEFQVSEPDSAQAPFEVWFDGADLQGWQHAGNWVVEDGAMHRADGGGGITYSRTPVPDNFELRFEWKVSPGANSGVYYRPGQYEYQVLDNNLHPDGKNPRTSAASLYFGAAPSHDATRPVGEWNTGRVICLDSIVQHWLNGVKVVHFDYDDPKWAKDVARLNERGGDLKARSGLLHLQDHGDPVWYRNIRIRPLPPGYPIDQSEITPQAVPAEAVRREQEILDILRQRRLEKAKDSANQAKGPP